MNELMGALILSAGISAASAGADDAVKALMKASYKQSKMDRQVKQLERRHIPKIVREYGSYTILITKLLTENKISYEWRF